MPFRRTCVNACVDMTWFFCSSFARQILHKLDGSTKIVLNLHGLYAHHIDQRGVTKHSGLE